LLLSLELYVMLVLANGAPVVAARILGEHWDQPVDGNRLWSDGRPVLGKSKTWRGLVSGCLACALFSLATGPGFLFGALFGFLGLSGDMISSFIKRRMGLQSSARALDCRPIRRLMKLLIMSPDNPRNPNSAPNRKPGPVARENRAHARQPLTSPRQVLLFPSTGRPSDQSRLPSTG